MTSSRGELDPRVRALLEPVIDLLGRESSSPSSPLATKQAWTVHVADSLSGLEFAELASAGAICDVGAGAGFPGLALAAALPDARVDLVESTGRKCEFIERAIAAGGIGNARVVNSRAEDWAGGEGHEAYDVVTARAVGRLSTLAELASPLLKPDGVLIAWKGRRDPDEEAELDRAADPARHDVGGGPLGRSLRRQREPPPAPDPQGRGDAGGPAATRRDGEEATPGRADVDAPVNVRGRRAFSCTIASKPPRS